MSPNTTDSLVQLVADLQSIGSGNTLRNALRQELDDPGLDIAYLRLGSGGWIDEHGRTMADPVAPGGRAVTTIDRGGKPFAALIHDPRLAETPERLRAAVDAVALAFDNEQLKADLRAEVDELRASRARIVNAIDLERRRAERDLHDGAQQRLVGLALLLRSTARQAEGDASLSGSLELAARELDEAIAELRDLARGMLPAVVVASGLAGALESLAERPGVPVTLRLSLPADLPAAVQVAAYYVAAEAVTNVNKHAGASTIELRASVSGPVLHLTVTDDGRGGAGAGPEGSGLVGLADRVAARGGRLDVADAPGGGTTLVAEIPLASPSAPTRDSASMSALCWVGWETFEIPGEAYDQLTHEDQRSWGRGMFACAGGVSVLSPAERAWAVRYEAAAGAADWVLESLRTHDADETVTEILALPGMQHAGRGLLYDAVRMCAADGALTADELGRLRVASDDLGHGPELVEELLALVADERALRRRRYETITAPVLPH